MTNVSESLKPGSLWIFKGSEPGHPDYDPDSNYYTAEIVHFSGTFGSFNTNFVQYHLIDRFGDYLLDECDDDGEYDLEEDEDYPLLVEFANLNNFITFYKPKEQYSQSEYIL